MVVNREKMIYNENVGARSTIDYAVRRRTAI